MSNIVKAASEKQLRWLANLLDERSTNGWTDIEQKRVAEIREAFAFCEENDLDPANVNVALVTAGHKIVTMDGFRILLDKLKASPIAVKSERGEAIQLATEPGIYKVGDDIFKVKFNRAGTNLYAHKLVVHGEVTDDQPVTVSFEYAGGLSKNHITADARLSYEDAKAFGALYGTCICCGKLLTNELSIALGIGPICGQRQFGGEFKFMLDSAKLAIKAAG